MLKKWLAIFLSAALVFSSTPVLADSHSNVETEAITESALSVIDELDEMPDSDTATAITSDSSENTPAPKENSETSPEKEEEENDKKGNAPDEEEVSSVKENPGPSKEKDTSDTEETAPQPENSESEAPDPEINPEIRFVIPEDSYFYDKITIHTTGETATYAPRIRTFSETGESLFPACNSSEEAGAIMREGMKKRQDTVCFSYHPTGSISETFFNDTVESAFQHTGQPTEGDYLKYQFGGCSAYIAWNSEGYFFTCYMSYYTTAEQEKAMDSAVSGLLQELNLDNNTNETKINKIYSYICSNITYDYANLYDEDYDLKYTAYAALINKTAVCQGYAVLLYRLLLECSIDGRIISGTSSGGGHAWNIVKLHNFYYNLDSTWDVGSSEYNYYLKCDENFIDHTRDAEYCTADFQNNYPIAPKDYAPSESCEHTWDTGTVTQQPGCTTSGTMIYTCTVCQETKQETINPTGHRWNSQYSIDLPSTCIAAGTKSIHCSVCDIIKEGSSVSIPPTGHVWNSGSITKKPTCTASGQKRFTCSVCNSTKTETLKPIAHTWNSWVRVSKATVFSAEKQSHTCKTCKKQETRTVGKALTPTITLNYTSLPLKIGQSTTAVKVSGLAAGDSVKSWTSSNTKIAKVDSKGKITAQKTTGKATITVTLASKKTAKIYVTVQKSSVQNTKLTGLKSSVTLKKGAKLTLQPVRNPITSLDKITYTSSNKRIVTVTSSGVLQAKATGTAKITVKCGKAAFYVTVKVPRVETTAISNVKTTLTLKRRATYTLKPKLTPANTDDAVTYSSSNSKIASVSSKGIIKGIKAGKAVITVKSGKKSVKCTVTVK